MTVGAADPAKRDKEAIAWVSSNYVTGFTYRWDRFKAPVAGPLPHPLQRLHAVGRAARRAKLSARFRAPLARTPR